MQIKIQGRYMKIDRTTRTENFGHWIGYHKDYLVSNLCTLMQKGKYNDVADAVRIINKLEKSPRFIFSYSSRSLNLKPKIIMEPAKDLTKEDNAPLITKPIVESTIGFFRNFAKALKKIEKVFDKYEPKTSVKNNHSYISEIKELIPHARGTNGDVDYNNPLYQGLAKLIKIDTGRPFKY